MVLFGLIELCGQSHVERNLHIINTYSFSVKTLQKNTVCGKKRLSDNGVITAIFVLSIFEKYFC